MDKGKNNKLILVFLGIIIVLLLFILFLNLKNMKPTVVNATIPMETINTNGAKITEQEYLNLTNQINQNLLAENNPSPQNVISIVNANIARVPNEVYANELAIAYLSAIIKYSAYLSDYINANTDLFLEAAKEYNLPNKEPVYTKDALLNGMISEIYKYPFSIVVDTQSVYLNLDYAQIADKYKDYISVGLYHYFNTFGEEYKKNLFDFTTGTMNINALIDRLEIIAKGLQQTEQEKDSAVIMYKLAYGDTLAHITGLSHNGFQDGINESTGYPNVKEDIRKAIENQMEATQNKRIKNDFAVILEAFSLGGNSYTEDCVAVLYNLCNFYDYQYGELFMDKTKLFSVQAYHNTLNNPDAALKAIYDMYGNKPYDDIGRLSNDSILLEYENSFTNTTQLNEKAQEMDALEKLNKILEKR